MSYWIEAKKKDMEIDGDELNIFIEQDESGARYVVVKIKDLKEMLHDSAIREVDESVPKASLMSGLFASHNHCYRDDGTCYGAYGPPGGCYATCHDETKKDCWHFPKKEEKK